MDAKNQPPIVILTLRAMPDRPGDADATERLRMLLKAMGRVYGWRCVSIHGAPQPTDSGRPSQGD